jgi:hypothetical protein
MYGAKFLLRHNLSNHFGYLSCIFGWSSDSTLAWAHNLTY